MRRTLFVLHQWLGFTVGVYLIAICTTGALLILLENRIEDFRDYPVRHVKVSTLKLPLDVLLQKVQRAYPGEQVTQVLLSCARGCTYDLSVDRGPDDRVDVLVNPYTGQIVQSVLRSQSALGFLYNFHADLFAGNTGSLINSIVGLIAVLQVLTGLYLWPGWLRLSRGFTIKWRANQWRLNFDLHKVVGISSLVFLIFIALTGAAGIIFAEPPTTAPRIDDVSKSLSRLSLDDAVSTANMTLPGKVTMIYPPGHGNSLVRVRKVVPGDPDPYGWSNVWINQSTGKVVAVYDSRKWPFWWRVYTYIYPLHIGSIGGFALRYVYVIFAITPILLYFTGFLMWLNRLKRDDSIITARITRLAQRAEAR